MDGCIRRAAGPQWQRKAQYWRKWKTSAEGYILQWMDKASKLPSNQIKNKTFVKNIFSFNCRTFFVNWNLYFSGQSFIPLMSKILSDSVEKSACSGAPHCSTWPLKDMSLDTLLKKFEGSQELCRTLYPA
ncbi:hypothetical protein PoB_000313100 [Plakobranchus ocellatus]|uniref:Uncharacterized protein n=1 Tax=Plakobranchus ocellatus TaxID=259542 RepID=A0AAV3XGJ7_9GAST|nr:hypothetical protein PoB_000313100 [Plakobranchus ocellatus]